MILALENSSPICSLALAQSPHHIIAKTDVQTDARYSETLLPSLDAWLKEQGVTLSQLDTLVYGRGPGSFTGVRIAAAMVQAIALPLQITPIAISSLATLAASAPPQTAVLSVLGAGLGEIYFAAYQRREAGLEVLHDEAAMKPEAVAAWLADRREDWLMLGTGCPALAAVWPQSAGHTQDDNRHPKAWHLLDLMESLADQPDANDAPPSSYLQTDRPWRRE